MFPCVNLSLQTSFYQVIPHTPLKQTTRHPVPVITVNLLQLKVTASKQLISFAHTNKFVFSSTAEVKRDHCNKTVDIYEDVSSPELTPENIGKPMTCWYRFRSFRGTPRDWILRIRFKKFKVGTLVNATHCHMGYMQVSLDSVCVCVWGGACVLARACVCVCVQF